MTSHPTGPRATTARPKLGLSVPNMAEPGVLVDLGVRAEHHGWDGFFLWDHAHGSPDMPVPTADPWVVLGALAVRTERIVLGTGITAPARRRPQKLARETVTVDRLSGGRFVLGAGLGEPPEEYTAYGESADRQVLADKLDESLDLLTAMWSGEPVDHEGRHYTVRHGQFLPTPLQEPRIPIWTAATVPHTKPLRRAARFDGVTIGNVNDSGALDPVPLGYVRTAIETIAAERVVDAGPFDVAVGHPGMPTDDELAAYGDAGVTWITPSGWIDDLLALAGSSPR